MVAFSFPPVFFVCEASSKKVHWKLIDPRFRESKRPNLHSESVKKKKQEKNMLMSQLHDLITVNANKALTGGGVLIWRQRETTPQSREIDEPAMYRIKDDLKFSVEIYEWSGKSWEPYVADDVQVQFYMMSPYVLKTLSTNGKGLYHASFKVPDVYGVFQFKVDYHRLGYTSLSLSKQFLLETLS
ncbi:uncharacterized protein LOC120171827 [Hibiscus syriacus]|uniref:uncharacterized protein LOC120171827 n=1 Tax=Hibiscus syriacus TaxID=106335 RepID=UPI0019225C94|nr:uncharacterized protein LOC120171827 [Hibiscus syriacus]